MGAEGDVGGGSGKSLQSHGQLPPGKMRIGCGVELGSARPERLLGECPPKRTVMSTSFFESASIDRCYPLTFLTAPPSRCTVRPLGSFLGSHQYAESSAKEDLCLSAEPFGPSQQPCASQPQSLSAHRESISMFSPSK